MPTGPNYRNVTTFTRKRPRRLVSSVCIAIVIAFVATACSTATQSNAMSNGTTAQSKSAKVTYGQGIDDKTIKIGISAPLAGAFAFAGDELVGTMKAYASYANEHGGIGGRKLEIIAYDNGAIEPAKDLANVQRLWSQDKVLAVYGLFLDSYAGYVRSKKIPAYTLGLSGPPFAKQNPTIFPINGNFIHFNQEFVYAIMKIFKYKPKTVAIQYDTFLDPATDYVGDFKKTWKDHGVKVVSTDVVNLTDNCATKIQKWRSLNVDWVQFMGLGYIPCLPAMGAIGWKPKVGMDAWATSVGGLASMMGATVDGLVTAWEGNRLTDGEPDGMTPEIKELQEAIKQYAPKLNTVDHLDSPVVRSVWVMLGMIRDWAEQKGRTDFSPASLVKWTQGLKNYKSGIDPPILNLSPSCKQGTGSLALGRWKYDDKTKLATRDPETKFIGPHNTPFIFKQQKKDPCYVAKRATKDSAG